MVNENSRRSEVRKRETRVKRSRRSVAWYDALRMPSVCSIVSGSLPKMLRHAVALPAHHVDGAATARNRDRTAVECQGRCRDVREAVVVDAAAEIRVAGFERPAEAAGLQVAQRRVIAADVQPVAAPRAAQLHLEVSELDAGLNPRDAEIRIDACARRRPAPGCRRRFGWRRR